MKYKRILLKLSGEVLAGEKHHGIDFDKTLELANEIKECTDLGYEIGIVVGGGNFWRGKSNEYMDRATSDYIGMMGTVMNALALGDAFKQLNVDVRVQTGVEMRQIAEFYIKDRAIRHLEKGRVVIFGCGTGSPFFSTDTASALRAAEIKADVLIKATKVNGVVITSSPAPIPKDFNAITNASVPFPTDIACLTPTYSANSFSNLSVYLPDVSQNSRELSTRFTISSCP